VDIGNWKTKCRVCLAMERNPLVWVGLESPHAQPAGERPKGEGRGLDPPQRKA